MEVCEWNDRRAWDNYVHASPDGTVCHLYNWREVIQRAYGHRTFYLSAIANGEIQGVLPLVLIQSRIFGRSLVSMPFMDYGGVVTQNGADVRNMLVDTALRLARVHRANLSLRCSSEQGLDLPVWLEKTTMFLELGTREDDLWKRLPSERRNRIRKGRKSGLVASFHGSEALDDFYAVFATNMRDLGSPVHSRQFFHEMFTYLRPYLGIVLVRYKGQAIGAACVFLYKDRIIIPGWISSLRPFFHLCPNQILYWEAMRFAIAKGYRLLDLGRSSWGSGTCEAKRQWGAEPVQLYWYYYPESALPPGEDAKRLTWAVRPWRWLPVPLANAVGPWLRRGIPN